MEARLDTPRLFYFLPPTQQLGLDDDLKLYVYDDAGVAVIGSPFSASLIVDPVAIETVGVYEAGPVTFPARGGYILYWTCASPAIKAEQEVTVLDNPLGDTPTQFSRKFHYATPGFVAATDVVLKVIKDGVQVGPTYTTIATATTGVYRTTSAFVLADAGVYLFVWTSALGGYTYTQIGQWLVLVTPTTRIVTIYVTNPAETPAVALQNIDVLISEEDGTPLQQVRTWTDGKAQFSLDDGDYVVSLRSSTGAVLSRNNVSITVEEPDGGDIDNVTYIMTTPFAATFDASATFDVTDKSLMTLSLLDGRGQPIVGTRVTLSPDRVLLVQSSAGIVGEVIELRTNGEGYAETYLMRGMQVTSTIERISFRRTFEVPDTETFNLLTVEAVGDDPLAVVVPSIQAAERRTP